MSTLPNALDQTVSALQKALGNNLHSCCLYGSTVRGDSIEGVSDINLLIVLAESTAEAHLAISRVIDENPKIDPFVLGLRGFERSVRAFAPKFLSIRRNYRVLSGADVLKDIKVDPQLERFLCEQAMRNLRLRLARAFICRHQTRAYGNFLVHIEKPLLLRLSEMLRLDGRDLPDEIPERIPIFSKEFGVDEQLFNDLMALKNNPRNLSDAEMIQWHERLFPAVDKALAWIETRWPQQGGA